MSIIGSNILAGASGQAGYNINNSLRFRASNSAYLSRTPGSAGNRQIFTWSGWVKRGALDSASDYTLFSAGAGSPNYDSFRFTVNQLQFFQGAGSVSAVQTTQVFRDPSAWYHLVLAVDTTQATAANRIKMYVNGNQITAFASAAYPTQNTSATINNTNAHAIGALWITSPQQYFDGYMTEINFIDGQALTPSSFGETSTTTGSWIPKKYTSTYGTNGFYLKGRGTDNSGNGNNWTENNFNTSNSALTTYDIMLDVPTNTSATVANYAVMNPLELGDGAPAALSNGNLTVTGSASLYLRRGTMNFPLTGKYYCEFTVTAVGSGVSIAYDSRGQSGATQFIQYDNGGTKNINGTTTGYGASYTTGDVIALAVDADGGNIYFYKNNTSQGAISFSSASMTGVNATAMVFAYTSAVVNANFGQRPFTYTAPSGFVALNTYNLPTPTILQGNKYMDATLWTGNGPASQVIVNQALFKPDLVWVKNRSSTRKHNIYDSVRGTTKRLVPNDTAAEDTPGGVTAFNSNGFTVDSEGDVNGNGLTFVGWQWQAGQGTTSSNTSGSITSTVSVNTTAGFSVVTFTGTGANATVGHGLGVAPKWVVVKGRSGAGAQNWMVYHAALGNTYYGYLNLTNAFENFSSTIWNNISPTSTTFSIGTNGNVNTSTSPYVAYCWAEIPGYSAFGSYVANASADGPFIFTGFRPKWIMFKRTTSATNWYVINTAISPYNSSTTGLYPNTTNAESTEGAVDILSNGFKCRVSSGAFNFPGGETFIYAAFAENPFKNANAR